MKDFTNITFKGVFRNYQQRVLDNSEKYINDGKIHVVAAPGSGKTILGLELINRLNSPCLIMSPTVTIRDQWGLRFKDFFIDKTDDVNDYVSYDLNNFKLLNSITYQALYSAMNKKATESEDETVDYSNIDIFKFMEEKGITTICLDEAHHLQNEWQKALEKFINKINNNKNIKIIALTATPPYDANKEEWERYSSICGEIDEEIFVPELVKTNTLCPHQDYIYFNFPNAEELEDFKQQKINAYKAVQEISKTEIIKKFCEHINLNYKNFEEYLYEHTNEFVSLLVLFKYANLEVNKKLIKLLIGKNKLPDFSLIQAEKAISFLISNIIMPESERQEIKSLCNKFSVITRGKVSLELTDSLKRKIIGSLGKLKSIEDIVESEHNSLNKKLRMLILTDYIKKDSISNVGTNKEFSNISIVSIFETVRRKLPNVNIGALSGTLVILPNHVQEYLINNLKLTNKQFAVTKIAETNYSVYNFKGNNKHKVSIVSQLFAEGIINILVGTKSLLGEGWDSPCINSLILASFVGSFMLSNQMRGRAIRIDKNNPDKVANIWHLATVEPNYIVTNKLSDKMSFYLQEEYNQLQSADFETLSRRFNCFVGPHYNSGEIESGIERISIIQPPFNKQGIENINKQMLKLSSSRSALNSEWNTALSNTSGQVSVVAEVPKEKKIPNFSLKNGMLAIVISLIEIIFGLICHEGIIKKSISTVLISSMLLFVFGICLIVISKKLFALINSQQTIKTLARCVLETLKEMSVIESSCSVKVDNNKEEGYEIRLKNASVREQNVFNTAISELLSPIENQRYIFLQEHSIKHISYFHAMACPSIIGQNKETAEILLRKLNKNVNEYSLQYTRNEEGRKILLKCKKVALLTINQKQLNKKNKLINFIK